MRYKMVVLLALLVGALVMIAAQFATPTVFGADGYLHIRMAEFLKSYGASYDFHWARFSVFANNFADKDFFYHLLLVPFTFCQDIFWGVKLSAVIFAIFLYVIFWLCLEAYCQKKMLIPLFLAAFFCSGAFLDALSQARNMILVIALTLIFVHFLIKKNYLALFAIGVLYTLAHVSGPYLLVFALLGELVRYLNSREFSRGNFLAVLAGVGLGFLAHPNFPNNLLVFYLNGIWVPIFSLKWGLELGAEFFPISTRDLALGYPLLLAGLLLLIACAINQQAKARVQTQIWLGISGFFLIFSFFSQRYLSYAYPLILVGLASYFSDWLQGRQPGPARIGRNKWVLSLAVIVATCVFAIVGYQAYSIFRLRAQAELEYNRHYESVGKWLARYIPKGEAVFHANWSDSQFFIGLNPKNDYLVTLDPIYMYYWSPRAYELYRRLAFGNTQDPYSLLKKIFKVNYGYASKNYFSGLIAQVRRDRRFEVLAEDYQGLIFRLRP